MRPGQAAPVFRDSLPDGELNAAASMRPGQAAPVFDGAGDKLVETSFRFNEAGAGCPGIRRSRRQARRNKLSLQ